MTSSALLLLHTIFQHLTCGQHLSVVSHICCTFSHQHFLFGCTLKSQHSLVSKPLKWEQLQSHGLQCSQHKQSTYAMLSMTFLCICCYGDIFMQQYNNRVCHSLSFLFSFCSCILFRSCFVYICISVQFTCLFLFLISCMLTQDTIAKILLTTQYFWWLHCHLYHACVAMIWLTRHLFLLLLQWNLKVWVKLAI